MRLFTVYEPNSIVCPLLLTYKEAGNEYRYNGMIIEIDDTWNNIDSIMSSYPSETCPFFLIVHKKGNKFQYTLINHTLHDSDIINNIYKALSWSKFLSLYSDANVELMTICGCDSLKLTMDCDLLNSDGVHARNPVTNITTLKTKLLFNDLDIFGNFTLKQVNLTITYANL